MNGQNVNNDHFKTTAPAIKAPKYAFMRQYDVFVRLPHTTRLPRDVVTVVCVCCHKGRWYVTVLRSK